VIEDYLTLVGQLYSVVLPVAAVIDTVLWTAVAVWALRRRADVPAGLRPGLAVAAGVVVGMLAVDPSWWRAVPAWAVLTAGAILWTRPVTPVDT
jgi:hypothetical protein